MCLLLFFFGEKNEEEKYSQHNLSSTYSIINGIVYSSLYQFIIINNKFSCFFFSLFPFASSNRSFILRVLCVLFVVVV